VRNIEIEGDLTRRDLVAEDRLVADSPRQFTSGDFFKDAGGVIAFCLGLGLLMQVLLG
jgi:hypothetical protein